MSDKSAFTLFKQSPKVKEALQHFHGADFEKTLHDARQGNQEAFYTIVNNGLTHIVDGYKKGLGLLPEQELIQKSHAFFHQFLHQLIEKDSILFGFSPEKGPDHPFKGPFGKFCHQLFKMAYHLSHTAPEEKNTGALTPDQEQKNLEHQEKFETYLKGINPLYARLFHVMAGGISVEGILDSFAWKSAASLKSKIDVLRGLYDQFLAEDHKEDQDVE